MRRDRCLRILAVLLLLAPVMLVRLSASASEGDAGTAVEAEDDADEADDADDADDAEDEDYEDEDYEYEDEPSWFSEYWSSMTNRGKAGLNGVITWPADPVILTRDGDEVFESVPAPSVTGRVLGFGAGLLQGCYRLVMGVCDIALSPVPYMPVLSPVQRYELIPFNHPDE
jgi:hypothetical protein